MAFAVLLLVAGAACSGKKERLIRQKVEERVADFRKKEAVRCRETLWTEAEKIVDSLLLYEALEEVNDSLKRLRPFRPVAPGVLVPVDSVFVKPIFE